MSHLFGEMRQIPGRAWLAAQRLVPDPVGDPRSVVCRDQRARIVVVARRDGEEADSSSDSDELEDWLAAMGKECRRKV